MVRGMASIEPSPIVLFCTDTIAETRGAEITAAASGVQFVALDGDRHVATDDLERITVAFFSGDAWPARSATFMQVCLQSPNLEWLHTFSD